MSMFNDLYESVIDADDADDAEKRDEWSQTVNVKRNRMHDLLGIPPNQTISDVYVSGTKLAKDLLKAVDGDKKQCASILTHSSNVDKKNDVLNVALKAIKKL